jgi:hypothetical protein
MWKILIYSFTFKLGSKSKQELTLLFSQILFKSMAVAKKEVKNKQENILLHFITLFIYLFICLFILAVLGILTSGLHIC